MTCPRISHDVNPASFLHRLCCRECRADYAIDRQIARGVSSLQNQPMPTDGLARMLAAVQQAEATSGTTMPLVFDLSRRPRRFVKPSRRDVQRFGVAVLAVWVPIAVWWHVLNLPPTAHIPARVVPNTPNAADYFMRAGVWKDYKKATDSAGKPLKMTLAERDNILRENAAALQTVRQGLAYPYYSRHGYGMTELYPEFGRYRTLAYLLAFEGETKALRGDWNGAANCYLDCIEMGVKMPHGGGLIAKLVGLACQQIGQKPLREVIPHLSETQATAAIKRLEAIIADETPYAEILEQEKYNGQTAIMEICRDPKWRLNWLKNTAIPEDYDRTFYSREGIKIFAKAMIANPRRSMDIYTQYMDQMIANARQPYTVKHHEPAITQDLICDILLPVFAGGRLKDVSIEKMQNAMLLVALGVQAFRQKYGDYPPNLWVIVPGYVSIVPLDPFSPSDPTMQVPLGYRRTKTGCVIYSEGPDGKDDGGKPIADPKLAQDNKSQARFAVQPDSQGDIVYGINTN